MKIFISIGFSFIVPRSLLLFGSEEISQEREDQESPKQMKEIERIQERYGRESKKHIILILPTYFLMFFFFFGTFKWVNKPKELNKEREPRKKTKHNKEIRNSICVMTGITCSGTQITSFNVFGY